MAHVILIRHSRSFVYGKNLILGTHQQIEKGIDERKYEINKYRKGYCIPTSSEWNLMDYRVKKDVIPDFINDINHRNLNPYPNNMTLIKIFKNNKVTHVEQSIGKTLMIIQWLFKWINKKKTTSIIFFIISILTLQLWLLILIPIILLNPIKPVPIRSEKERKTFTVDYNTNYIIGMINDPTQTSSDGIIQEDIL